MPPKNVSQQTETILSEVNAMGNRIIYLLERLREQREENAQLRSKILRLQESRKEDEVQLKKFKVSVEDVIAQLQFFKTTYGLKGIGEN